MFIIGDLHSNYRALEALINMIKPRGNTILVFLGDYIDKLPGTVPTLGLLASLAKEHRCVFLKGNHEFVWDRYLNWREPSRREFLLNYGGVEALRGQADDPEALLRGDRIDDIRNILAGYLDLISRTRDYEVAGPYLAVHAGLLPSQLDDPAPRFEEMNYFIRPDQIDQRKKYLGRIKMVAGHTHLGPEPKIEEGYINIDLGAGYPGGYLGCLDVENGLVLRSDGQKFAAVPGSRAR